VKEELRLCKLYGFVHVDNPLKDTTLCGCALEGEYGDEVAVDTKIQTITCQDCLRLIRYVMTIPIRILTHVEAHS
jgi:hypothetical protein